MSLKTYFYSIIILTVVSAGSSHSIKQATTKSVAAQTKPNILWIVTEDISPTLSFYSDYTAKTPNLDLLASESLIFDNAFTTVGVCGPSRSSIITGMHPTSIGTMHMRAAQDVFSWGSQTYKENIEISDIIGEPIRQYSTVIPEFVKCYTEFLRAEGYYCTNNAKTDYQFSAPVTAWDENNNKAHWRNRPKDKPFFAIFNIDVTHESFLWRNNHLPLTVSPNTVNLPPYLPNNEQTRQTVARHYSNVELMDKRVGEIINQLKEDGLYNNTIIFFYSDHGGPLPRQKRAIYDSGLKVPFIIKDIESKTTGHTDRLISFIDLAPTMLSIAGIKPPNYLEGKAFMGQFETVENSYIFASSDRFDEHTDRIRAVRNKRYLYLRNSFPELPKYKDIRYRKNIPMMESFLKLRDENNLNDIQKIWFENKTNEELYDTANDPHNINNLIDNPDYQTILFEMRKALLTKMQHTPDLGQLPESQLIDMMWPKFIQPKTAEVEQIITNNNIELFCKTSGASIAYIVSNSPNETFNLDSGWQLYTKPLKIPKGKYIYTMAHRIGFERSIITITAL